MDKPLVRLMSQKGGTPHYCYQKRRHCRPAVSSGPSLPQQSQHHSSYSDCKIHCGKHSSGIYHLHILEGRGHARRPHSRSAGRERENTELG